MPSGNMWTGETNRIARTNATLGGNLDELLGTPIRLSEAPVSPSAAQPIRDVPFPVKLRVLLKLDPKTRSMPVELDVINKDQMLAPGMYPTVRWPVRGSDEALFVPKTSVVTTTERTFVVRDKDGRAEWVNVQRDRLMAT